jgi:hypothetical protein
MWTENWLECLAESEESFGHNCWDDTKDTIRQFKALEKLGAQIYLDKNDWSLYNIRLDLPSNSVKKSNILLHLLTKCPSPSAVTWRTLNKKKMLDIEWHW